MSIFGSIGGDIGGFFSGLSGNAQRALEDARDGIAQITNVTLSIPNLSHLLTVDPAVVASAIGDARFGFAKLSTDLKSVGRIDAELANDVLAAAQQYASLAHAYRLTELDQVQNGVGDTTNLYLTARNLDAVSAALGQIRSIGDPDGAISRAIQIVSTEALGITTALVAGNEFGVISNLQGVAAELSIIDDGVLSANPGGVAADLARISEDVRQSAYDTQITGASDPGALAATFASTIDALVDKAADLTLEAQSGNFLDGAALGALGQGIGDASYYVGVLQQYFHVSSPALTAAQARVADVATAIDGAIDYVAQRAPVDAFVSSVTADGWDGPLGASYLDAITGDGAVFGGILGEVAPFVNFEAIGGAFQDLATLDIDLSRDALSRYEKLLDLPQALITPTMAGVFQQLPAEALTALAASTGAIFESITKSAVDGVTDGFDGSIAFLSDLAHQIGDGFLGVADYLQTMLLRYANELAELVQQQVFDPVQDLVLGLVDGLNQIADDAESGVLGLIDSAIGLTGGIEAFIAQGEAAAGVVLDTDTRAAVIDNISAALGQGSDTISPATSITVPGQPEDDGIDFLRLGYSADLQTGALAGRAGAFVDVLNSDFLVGDIVFGALSDLGVFADLMFLQNTRFDIEADLQATARAYFFSDGGAAPITTEVSAGFDFDARIELEIGKLIGFGASTIGLSLSALRDVGWVPNTDELLDDPGATYRLDETPDFFRTDIDFGLTPEFGDRTRASEEKPNQPGQKGQTLIGDAIWEIDSYAPIEAITRDGQRFEEFRGSLSDLSFGGGGNAGASDSDPAPAVYAPVLAVNAGGGAYTATDGTVYQADTYGIARPWYNPVPIAGTEDDTLYQTETVDLNGFTYDIALADGTYQVELHFAEIWHGGYHDGVRVFDVAVEDQLLFDDLDIFSEVGANTAFVVQATVEVQDGALTIETSSGAQNPKISAFSIWSTNDVPSPEDFTELVEAVNAGGAAYTSQDGVDYRADDYWGGRRYSNPIEIAGTDDDVLYQSEAVNRGGFEYDIAVENGTYLVELNFAEIYHGGHFDGARVFDVLLEDQLIFDDLDVFAEAGANTAFDIQRVVEVDDGVLTIQTDTLLPHDPKLSAFSIWALAPDAEAADAVLFDLGQDILSF
ncbi:MAG: malectin [Pseudomonadota bacterium]